MAASRKKKSPPKNPPSQKTQEELLARAVEEVDAQLRQLNHSAPIHPASKESTENTENTENDQREFHTSYDDPQESPVSQPTAPKEPTTHSEHTEANEPDEETKIAQMQSSAEEGEMQSSEEGGEMQSPEEGGEMQQALLSGGLVLSSRMERVRGWGMSHGADMYATRPTTVEQAQRILERAHEEGVKITLRGSGQSYGDASIGQDRVLLDLTRMRRVLAWDPSNGVIDVEPGVRIVDLWHYTLEDGWWPPVVSGTMRTSLGGGLGVNIHGKNSFKYGTLGDHVLEIDVLTGDGRLLTCSPSQHREVFYGVIGSGGVLGVITRIRLQMKRVYSGEVLVETFSTRSIQEMIDVMEAHLDQDYLVGWVDALAPGFQLGRGTLHVARNLQEGEDKRPHHTLKLSYQELPEVFLGVVPKSMLWMGLWMFLHRPGMRLVNTAKFYADRREASRPPYRQSHAGFNFLLDYVPGWQKSYQPGGLIQYQTFVPKAAARQVFEQQILLSQKAGIPPFLAVLKKHLPDPFLMSYNVDGYSFALDYPVRERNQRRLHRLAHEMTEVVLQHSGRFYFAKDGLLTESQFKRSYPADRLRQLRSLKSQLDPAGILTSDLADRIGLLKE